VDGGAGGTSFGAKYFPALGKRNFRIFWLGQCVSLVGTWMQNVGQSWLVLELTGSPAKLGLVSALQFLPMMLFSLVAGPFVDRFPKRKTLVATQGALLVLALALATLTATGLVRYWMVLVLAFLLGMVNLVDVPTRQSFVIELAGRESLVNAVSLNSAAFNLARIFGPAAIDRYAGYAADIHKAGQHLLDIIAVIAALLAIDAPPLVGESRTGSVCEVLASVKEGLSYIKGKREIALPLVLMALISTFVINYNIYVPTFARGPLGRGASGYGFLMTAMGAGSLAAALLLATRSGAAAAKGKGTAPGAARLFAGAIGMSACLALCGLQRSYALTAALLALTGFCTIVFTASANAGVQLASDDAHRGRVMSVYSLVFGGVTPVGSLYAGSLTDAAGPAAAMAASGAVGLAASLAIGLAARRRRAARRTGP